MHYIGFDIRKKVISFCEKLMDGTNNAADAEK